MMSETSGIPPQRVARADMGHDTFVFAEAVFFGKGAGLM